MTQEQADAIRVAAYKGFLKQSWRTPARMGRFPS